MIWLLVGLGGAIGSMARHGVGVVFGRVLPAHIVPGATLAVNLLGCLIIGVLAGLSASGRVPFSPSARAFVFVGVLGGFTTFSSFGLDSFTLFHGGRHSVAAGNVLAQVLGGLALVAAGFTAAMRT